MNKEVGYPGFEIPSSFKKKILLDYYKRKSPFDKGKGVFNLKEDYNYERALYNPFSSRCKDEPNQLPIMSLNTSKKADPTLKGTQSSTEDYASHKRAHGVRRKSSKTLRLAKKINEKNLFFIKILW